MCRAMLLTLFATLAVLACAVPVSTNSANELSFKAPAKGHGKRSPLREIHRAAHKYALHQAWDIIIITPTRDNNTVADAQPSAPSSTAGIASQINSFSPTPTSTSLSQSTSYPATPSTSPSSEDGEVTATPEENDKEYLSPVTIGGQQLTLNFDTGSADLWVFSTELSSSEIGQHSAFNPAKSSTWQDWKDATWNISYGDASSAEGTAGFDVVDIGGSTVQKQCVEIATQISEQFVEDANSDGLLGLAFGSINRVQPHAQKTFFENVMPDLSQPVFTVDLEETDGRGTYEFGTIDQTKYKGDIHYTPVDSSGGFWTITTPSFQIGGQKHTCSNCVGAVDTGTSLILVYPEVAQAYYDAVPGSEWWPAEQGYIYPCSTNLPDFALEVGGFMATVKGSDMTYMDLYGDGSYCYGGIQETSVDIQIIGDVFLRQFFAVFDGGKLQFGVAEKS